MSRRLGPWPKMALLALLLAGCSAAAPSGCSQRAPNRLAECVDRSAGPEAVLAACDAVLQTGLEEDRPPTPEEQRRIQVEIARAHYDLGSYEAARDAVEAGLAIAPEDPLLLFERGKIGIAEAELEAAQRDFSAAIRGKPDYYQAMARRGEAFELQARYQAALRDYERALALDQQPPDWLRDGRARMTCYLALRDRRLPYGPPRALVVRVQDRLRGRGERPGPSDGRIGPSTHRAILRFQVAENLAPIGRIDSELLRALGLATGAPDERDVMPPVIIAERRLEVEDEAVELLGAVQDDRPGATITVDGETVAVTPGGCFRTTIYIPLGVTRTPLVARDAAGQRAAATITIERRRAPPVAAKLAPLEPLAREGTPRPRGAALVIGVEDYDCLCPASYARKDAELFFDYARRNLGIPNHRIKLLPDRRLPAAEQAAQLSREGILEAVREVRAWVEPEESELFVFYAGNGLIGEGGARPYLLPLDAAPGALPATGIALEDLVGRLEAGRPRSLTVFLDVGFSGQDRSGSLMFPAMEQPEWVWLPRNHRPGTAILAAADRSSTANQLDQTEHGLFSYFLMRGLEGAADGDRDRRITLDELYAYVDREIAIRAKRLGSEQARAATDPVACQVVMATGTRLVTESVFDAVPAAARVCVLRAVPRPEFTPARFHQRPRLIGSGEQVLMSWRDSRRTGVLEHWRDLWQQN